MLAPFADERACDVARAGGKGSSLARMVALGLPVPPGFVVLAETLSAALDEAGVRDDLRAALADAARAQTIIGALAPPEVGAAYASLGNDEPAVAVRSSAVAEDSGEASFAGQQETYLHVRGAASVAARVRDCWASFFSERALFYRAQMGSLDDLEMAVVVQRMVEPDVAGILFTADPVQRRRDQMIVEAVFGLGELAVSGTVTPDNYVLARDGRLKRSRIVEQRAALVGLPAGGTEERLLSPEQGAAPTLGEHDLRRLAELGQLLEGHHGVPQDIEWAIADGVLYVLQSRPVTTL
ncbi:MAG: pyruvate, water dikinase [Actinomycetota bacterium]|nr:pyruvate, water dikinase [Actinomycetota bacterium]